MFVLLPKNPKLFLGLKNFFWENNLMKEYVIKLNKELDLELERRAQSQGVTKDQYLNNWAKLFLSASHSIDREEFAKGYEEMGAINLELANIGDCGNGKTEHKKRLNIFRRPKSGGRK
jgi:hypothetical protein